MSTVHVTLEIDMPIEKLKRLLLAIKAIDDDEMLIASFYRRGENAQEDVAGIHRAVFPETPFTMLYSATEVRSIKERLRGMS